MSRFISILPLFLVIGAIKAQICPPAESLLPCRCNEAVKTISCENIRGRFDIKAVFDNVSSLVDENTIFEEFFLFETSGLFEIPAGAVQTLKFNTITIMNNENLEYISPDAFNASTSVTKRLDLWLNYISNQPPYEKDIFDFMSKFTNVESIWIPNNRLISVPDNAFGYLPKLDSLYLGSNGISQIGARAFSQLPNLAKLYFSSNSVPSDGLHPDAFQGVSSKLDIDLGYNAMDYVGEGSFKPLLDNALLVAVGGSSCGHNGCSYQYLTCDERADWICENEEAYRPKLFGFRCTDRAYEDVWAYCAYNGTRHL